MSSQLERARTSSVELRSARAGRPDVVRTIRDLECAVVDALDGERLRGLPNVGTRECPIYGLRMRGSPTRPITHDGRPVLIIDDCGMLAMVGTDGAMSEIVMAEDGDLFAEDVERYTSLIRDALTQHVASAERATSRYRRCTQIASLITEALTKIV